MSKVPSDGVEDAATKSILIVDDESGVLRVCRRLLERAGHIVHTADRGHKALDLFEEDAAFDLLVCDVDMPEMTGDELVEQVCRLRPHLPVIFISGHLLESQPSGAPNIGDNVTFLKKPFTGTELIEAAAYALDVEEPTS